MSTVEMINTNHSGVSVTLDSPSQEVRIAVLDRVVMVVYSAGWPVSRPTADNVIAVGHTGPPSWLDATDIWLEDVSE